VQWRRRRAILATNDILDRAAARDGGGCRLSATRTPQQQLLEREDELDRLTEAIAGAARGRGVVVLVRAAAGLGKSRLLDAAEIMAADAGFDVLHARGLELERDFPLGVAVQLFEARMRAATLDEREALLSGSARLAAPLFSGGTPIVGAEDEAPGGATVDFALLHGLHWLAANLSERRPVALLVDDAHWADRLSLRFLLYLTERITDLPMIVAAAARPHEAGDDEELLTDLAYHQSTVLLGPEPLSPEAVAQVVGRLFGGADAPDPEFCRACHQVTGGNPLLLRELIAALIEEGAPPSAGSVLRVRQIGPEPVSRAIFLALRRLGREATALARAVAVLDDGAEHVAAAELADLDLRSSARAAAQLETARLFARGTTLAFAHPILRSSVYEELTASERAHAHHLAARVLGDSGPLERVAAHLIASPPTRDPWAVVMLRRAAAEARNRGAPEAAARYLERALAEPPAEGDLVDVLLELGRMQSSAGVPGAVDTLEHALAATDDPRRRAQVLLDVGRTLYGQGHFTEAAAAFDRGSKELGEGPDELKLELESGFASAALWDPEGGREALERLAPLLGPEGEPRTLGERVVLANLAGLEMLRGENRERAIELALRAWGDGAYLEQTTADDPSLSAITGALTPSDAFDESIAIATAAIDDARRRGSLLAFATASYIRSAAHFHAGHLAEAAADAEQAINAHRYGWEAYLAAALWVLTMVMVERGELDEAAAKLELPAELEQRLGSSSAHSALHQARGNVALARGDAATALAEFRTAGRLVTAGLGNRNPALIPWQSSAALAAARIGDRAEAVALADEEIEAARRYGAPRALSAALRARGIVEGGTGSLPFLQEAVEVLEESPAQLEHAHALVALGTALRRNGKRASSREPLAQGLDLADRCGALALAARAREELLAAGARPRRARVSGPESLTPSEHRVASMAAEGLTNREIAEALFVTRKAVEYHLGNVFRKLDVNKRGELPSVLSDLGSS
jgi:DNA-binding CsgD family transcriptional regulator